MSCPSISLCVAVDVFGNVITSTDPTGGKRAWKIVNIDGELGYLSSVSCPSVSLCVAFDWSGNVLTSTDPTGGKRAWRITHVYRPMLVRGIRLGPTAVSCASASLCVAVGWFGQLLTSTDPTGGAHAWSLTRPDGRRLLEAVACPEVSLCLAVDDAGNVVLGASR